MHRVSLTSIHNSLSQPLNALFCLNFLPTLFFHSCVANWNHWYYHWYALFFLELPSQPFLSLVLQTEITNIIIGMLLKSMQLHAWVMFLWSNCLHRQFHGEWRTGVIYRLGVSKSWQMEVILVNFSLFD